MLKRAAKPKLLLAVLGHVDAGKTAVVSSLLEINDEINRTIQPCERVPQTAKDLWEKYQKSVLSDGVGRTTLKVLQFESHRYILTVHDASGFRDYFKNMITGFTRANAGLLVVGAAQGEFESGISMNGQTREHLVLASTMGKQLLIAVNKMDTVNYSQERFGEIKREILALMRRIGMQSDACTFVPVSYRTKANFDTPADEFMPWYKGPTLMQALNELKMTQHPVDHQLRLTVHGVYKIKGVGVVAVGRVETGVLKVNDKIVIAPGNTVAEVKSIEMNNKRITEAYPGDNVGFNIEGVSAKDLRNGCVVGHADHDPPAEVIDFIAQITIVDHPGEIRVGYSPVVDCHSSHVACKFAEFLSAHDKQMKEIKGPVNVLKRGFTAVVRLVPTKPMVVESCTDYAPLGHLVVRDMKTVVAVGKIKSVNKKRKDVN